jgi:hypothetical protein
MTFNEGLQWLITIGLAAASTVLTGAIIKMVQDSGHSLNNRIKEYLAYLIPFVLVGLGYGGQLVFGYRVFSIDDVFTYVLNAGAVAFGSQLLYTAYRSAKQANPPTVITPATAAPIPDSVFTSYTVGDEWRQAQPGVDLAQEALGDQGRQPPPVHPSQREG